MSPTSWTPATAPELSRLVTTNFQQEKTPLIAVGGRTALQYGGKIEQLPGEAGPIFVLMEGLNRVIDYPARDMTVTVEAGLRIDELQNHLASENQYLPIDIPQSHRATIGGAIAANASGPGRYGFGTFRDYVLGISAVDGRGRLFSAGGRVVKNVAGYDLCKLLVGSLGTLAIITQVTLKLLPVPQSRELIVFPCEELSTLAQTLDQLNLSSTRPVLLDVLNEKAARQLNNEIRLDLPRTPWVLCVGYIGSAAETAWQRERLQSELQPFGLLSSTCFSGESAQELWKGLTEYQAASDDPVTFRASLLPSHLPEFLELANCGGLALQAHAGNGIVIGHLPDRCADSEAAAELMRPLRGRASAAGGSLIVTQCDEEWKPGLDIFGSLGSGELLMRDLKRTLDPANVLNPGRFWPVAASANSH